MVALKIEAGLEQFLTFGSKVIHLAPSVVLGLRAILTPRVQDTQILHRCLRPNHHHHHERPHKLLKEHLCIVESSRLRLPTRVSPMVSSVFSRSLHSNLIEYSQHRLPSMLAEGSFFIH